MLNILLIFNSIIKCLKMTEKNPITANTKILCVIGHPIEHSMSPIMHNAALRQFNLDYVYLAFNIFPSNLKFAMKGFRAFNIIGINVTLPFKQEIMKYLDEIDPLALKIGAVNTIKNDEGYFIGRNTDAEGAMNALLNAGYTIQGKNILLLGAGGTARALVYIMAEDANKIVIANRTEKKAVKLANEINKYFNNKIEGKSNSISILKQESKKADILINTTPLGMYPNIDQSPIPADFLHEGLFVFDVVYNPLNTKLIKDATEKGCQILEGLNMLVNQGAIAFEWWTNRKPNINLMRTKVIEFLG